MRQKDVHVWAALRSLDSANFVTHVLDVYPHPRPYPRPDLFGPKGVSIDGLPSLRTAQPAGF